jgi:hypothetical protein
MAKESRVRSAKELAAYFTQEDDGVVFVSHEDPDEVTSDQLIEMSRNIVLGDEKPPAGSSAAYREAWEELREQIKEIHDRGGIVELPSELP